MGFLSTADACQKNLSSSYVGVGLSSDQDVSSLCPGLPGLPPPRPGPLWLESLALSASFGITCCFFCTFGVLSHCFCDFPKRGHVLSPSPSLAPSLFLS